MTIVINHNTPTELTFDVEVDGLKSIGSMVTRFIIEASPQHSLVFGCNLSGDKQYSVTLPSMVGLLDKNKTYSFIIEALVDGYYFKALQDTLSLEEQVKTVTATLTSDTKQPESTPVATKKESDSVVPNKSELPQTSVGKTEPNSSADEIPSNKIEPAVEPAAAPPATTVTDVPFVFDKKKTTESADDIVKRNQAALNIINEHQRESQQRKNEMLSKELATVLEARERNKKAKQIIESHMKSKQT